MWAQSRPFLTLATFPETLMSTKARTRTIILGWTQLVAAGLGFMELSSRIALTVLGLPVTYDRPQRSEFEPWGAARATGSVPAARC